MRKIIINILKSFTDFSEKHSMLPGEGLVLAAVSGGADSMCLLSLLYEMGPEKGFDVAALHYNHRLRGQESDRDEKFVEDFCKQHNIKLIKGLGDVAGEAARLGLGIEETARKMRYDFFYEAARRENAVKIATAHNADDNTETVLFNLMRGTGAKGLSGIPPVRGILIRPLLSTGRREIEAYLKANNIPNVEDSSNYSAVYTRNRLRHEVIPVLKELNPQLNKAVGDAAERLRADEYFIRGLAEDLVKNCDIGENRAKIPAGLLDYSPVAVRLLLLALDAAGLPQKNISSGHISRVMSLASGENPSGRVDLPGGVSACREYGYVIISEETRNTESFEPKTLVIGGETDIPELGMSIGAEMGIMTEKVHNSLNTFFFKIDCICGNIIARPRKTGDKIKIIGGNGTRSLKKLFIDRKIPKARRGLIPVLADDNGPIAVYGIGVDERCSPGAGDKILKVYVRESI